jgi:hypothetical protein
MRRWTDEGGGSPFTKLGLVTRLCQQLGFIRDIDALKEIWRRTLLLDGSCVEGPSGSNARS